MTTRPSLLLLALAPFWLAHCGGSSSTPDSPAVKPLGAGGSSSGSAGAAGSPGHGGFGAPAGNGGTGPSGGAAGKGGAGAAGGSQAGAGGSRAGNAGASGAPATAGGSSGSSGAGATAGDGGSGGASGAGAGFGGAGGAGAGGSAAGSAGSAGQGGASGMSGGASGSGGAQAGEGGAAGTAGPGGAAGSSGTGGAAGQGAAGASGTGGAAGQGAAGSTGGAGSTPALVVLALSATVPAPFAASYVAGSSWAPSVVPAVGLTGRPALTRWNGGVLAAARGSVDSRLLWSLWTAGSFGSFALVDPAGSGGADDGPSLATHAATATITYLGLAPTHYHLSATFTGAGFGTVVALGTDMVTAFGQSASSVAAFGEESWALYAGDNSAVYAVHNDGQAWSASTSIAGAGTKRTLTPAVVVDRQGNVVVFYVGVGDNFIWSTTRDAATGAWSAPLVIAQSALGGSRLSAAVTTPGDVAVVWHGFSDQGVYLSRGAANIWSAPVAVAPSAETTSDPVITGGLDGADAEVVYVRGGAVYHNRILPNGVQAPTKVGGAGLDSLDASLTIP